RPDRHLGVANQLQAGRGLVGVREEVEPADLVRAVVRAVAGADAAIVGHLVQPLEAVRGGGHGADDLAGGLLAVHAEYGLKIELGIAGVLPLEVAVDADPVHLARGEDLVPADDRDVVLGLAGDHAGIAADAGVEVDHHAPGVAQALLAAHLRLRLA